MNFTLCEANYFIQFNNLGLHKSSYDILRTIIDNREALLLNVFPNEDAKKLLHNGFGDFPEESTEQIFVAEVNSKYVVSKCTQV